jgi:hypothetical protein
MGEAESNLIRAKNLTRGLDRSTCELGRLYLLEAGREARPEERTALAQKASSLFDQALLYEPRSAPILADSANADALYLGKPDAARQKMDRALEIAGNRIDLWGDYCRDWSLRTTDTALKSQYAAFAVDAYEAALKNPLTDEYTAARCHLGEATLLMARNDTTQALAHFLEALKQPLGNDAWKAEASVALIYAQQGNLPAARDHIARALNDAPLDRRPGLEQLRRQLGGQ